MDAKTDGAVILEISNGVAHLTLNRPRAANSMDLEMAEAIASAALQCERDLAVRAVLIRGDGDCFSAGGDLKAFAAKGGDLPAYLREVTAALHLGISRLARGEAPVIAAVHGVAAGAGFSLMCACDIVLASESASFLLAYTKIGMVPDGSSTYFLPRVVGMRRAMEIALLNRKFSAREAHEWGLVTEVVPDAELAARAGDLAANIAAGPTRSFGATKRLLLGSWEQSLESQMELESRAIAQAATTADGQEGIAAFVQKRRPNYRGE
jgi:2-(1,2-epoxy-1,2-dihydrophenyl)acetyl-CoA isomerase